MQTIALSNGSVALVDDEDAERLESWRWYWNKGYAYGYMRGKKQILMHRLIMNPPDRVQIDHINGDRLDNRKENLRFCTPIQNRQHVTKRRKKQHPLYKCIRQDEAGKWTAYIGSPQRYLGYFATPEEAAAAYNRAAIEQFGEFADLNDVPDMEINPIRITDRKSSSGHYGVYWDKKRGKWKARVRDGKKGVYLGRYDVLDDAITAVNKYLESRATRNEHSAENH